MPTYDELRLGLGDAGAMTRDRTHAVFGQVMGLVALTLGCAALGAYIGRNLTDRASHSKRPFVHVIHGPAAPAHKATRRNVATTRC